MLANGPDGPSWRGDPAAERAFVVDALATMLARTGRLAVNKAEAAALLGVGLDYFTKYVEPEVRAIRRGQRHVLFPVIELGFWLWKSSSSPGDASLHE